MRIPLLLAALAAVPALAQTPPAQTTPVQTPPAPAETRAEAEARADQMHAQMDLDHDGVITFAELGDYLKARAPASPGRTRTGAPPFARAMFDDADADHDGRISKAESRRAMLRGFEESDTNHDGTVTAAERDATAKAVRQGPPVPAAPSGR